MSCRNTLCPQIAASRSPVVDGVVAQVTRLTVHGEPRLWVSWVVRQIARRKDHAIEPIALAHRERTVQRATSRAAPASGLFGGLGSRWPLGWREGALERHVGPPRIDLRRRAC